jgi:hypothetical protein
VNDVVVGQRRRDPGLVEEHLHDFRAFDELLAQTLDHQLLGEAFDARVLGAIDLGHAAGGDVLDEQILVAEGRGLDVAQDAGSLVDPRNGPQGQPCTHPRPRPGDGGAAN